MDSTAASPLSGMLEALNKCLLPSFPFLLPLSSAVDSQVRHCDFRCGKMVTTKMLSLLICFSSSHEESVKLSPEKKNLGLGSDKYVISCHEVPQLGEHPGDRILKFFKWPIFIE